MTKKLSYRQQQFLSQFLELYREMDQPVHYGTLAERLGVGKVTVYEMLRLLEERGLVRSEYQSNLNQHGPGRPSVLFYPTAEGDRLIQNLAGDADNQENWKAVKEQILQQLRAGKAAGYEELLSDLLARIPERRSPLIFVTELVTAVILMLDTIQEAPEIRRLIEQLYHIGLPKEFGLSVLSGIAMFLSVLERANRRFSTLLLAQINRYENALAQLNEENRQQVSEFTREVVHILTS
jgi:DNA-binding MarR family transcriptional regulator